MKNGEYDLILAPSNFPGLKYRGRYCLISHYVYWKNAGVVPTKDEIIHHKNHNKKDNSFENLELISRKEHSKMHVHERGRKFVLLKCPQCNKIFERPKSQSFLQKNGKYNCCSMECAKMFASRKKTLETEKQISECLIKEFVKKQ